MGRQPPTNAAATHRRRPNDLVKPRPKPSSAPDLSAKTASFSSTHFMEQNELELCAEQSRSSSQAFSDRPRPTLKKPACPENSQVTDSSIPGVPEPLPPQHLIAGK